jgi:NAD(P)-dependent dehydrogenase (short-subunit alcohol dehydrogenase family)
VKVAVITGAASGIGAASARALAREGFHVWCADRDGDGARATAARLAADGAASDAVAVDVSDPGSVRAAFDAVADSSPAIDVLVSSAGVIVVSRFEEGTKKEWERVYSVNVVGAYLCLQAALPLLRRADPGRVVNIASAAAKTAGPFTAAYNASKAALVSLTRSAAQALAPEVLVNSVCPGVIDTPMWRNHLGPGLAAAGAGAGTTFEERSAALPIRRAGTPEEVAEVVAFLASTRSSYVLGEDVNVNGGLAMY